jgi:lipid A 4'-phosphatase
MIVNPTFPRRLLASALVFTLLFLAWPQVDLNAIRIFYDFTTGFLLSDHAFYRSLHKNIGLLPLALLAWSAMVWLLSLRGKHADRWRARRPAALFLTLSMLFGPGLMVNVVFKDQWGRARPAQVEEFGGNAQFTPAWVISDQCDKNCSFVCGDASVGFALLAIAFVSRRPRVWLFGAIAAGTALGLMRMAQGGHFLSDVIFSFFVVFFTIWGLHHYLTRRAGAMRAID